MRFLVRDSHVCEYPIYILVIYRWCLFIYLFLPTVFEYSYYIETHEYHTQRSNNTTVETNNKQTQINHKAGLNFYKITSVSIQLASSRVLVWKDHISFLHTYYLLRTLLLLWGFCLPIWDLICAMMLSIVCGICTSSSLLSLSSS